MVNYVNKNFFLFYHSIRSKFYRLHFKLKRLFVVQDSCLLIRFAVISTT